MRCLVTLHTKQGIAQIDMRIRQPGSQFQYAMKSHHCIFVLASLQHGDALPEAQIDFCKPFRACGLNCICTQRLRCRQTRGLQQGKPTREQNHCDQEG